MRRDNGSAARLWLLLAAVLFSTGGAAVKLSTLQPIQVACLRSGIAAVALWCFSRDARRRPRDVREVAVAFAFAVTMLLFVLASRATTAAHAVFLQATAPLYVLLLGPLLLRERLRRTDLYTMLGMGLGIAFFFAAPTGAVSSATDPVLGNRLAAASGLTWAASILGLRWINRSSGGLGATLRVVVLGNALVAIVTAAFAFPMELPGLGGVLVILWLGVFQIGLAYVCVARGIAGVTAFEASLLFLLEPVLSPLWAWWLHAERPGGWALVGAAVILATAIHNAVAARARAPD